MGVKGLHCFTAVFLVVVGQCLLVSGYKQELVMYFEDSEDANHMVFTKNEASLTSYTSLLPTVRRVCFTGVWVAYTLASYETEYESFGTESSTGRVCKSYAASHFSNVKSLRHLAANDTQIESISVYEKLDHQGTEVFITQKAYTNIPGTKLSLAVTGLAGYTVFEGKFLDGKSECVKPTGGNSFAVVYYVVTELQLTTVGSVFQGCNIREIREYKLRNKLM